MLEGGELARKNETPGGGGSSEAVGVGGWEPGPTRASPGALQGAEPPAAEEAPRALRLGPCLVMSPLAPSVLGKEEG